MVEVNWILLIHHIPPKPDYFRVKVRRRLQKLGALPLKNSVYVLPLSDETTEDFQWLRKEILTDGGDVTICHAAFVEGVTDNELERMFVDQSNTEYSEIVESVEREGSPGEHDVRRFRRQLAEASIRDFFEAPGRAAATSAITALEKTFKGESVTSVSESGTGAVEVPARSIWVTREGVFVDRIASAWLIKKFIDHEARFKFVAAEAYQPRKGEFRFDMFDGEFTHEGDRCTFETLIDRFGLGTPELRAMAEVIHDIDLKDGKYERDEAAGIAAVLKGICRTHDRDGERIQAGSELFDELLEAFRSS